MPGKNYKLVEEVWQDLYFCTTYVMSDRERERKRTLVGPVRHCLYGEAKLAMLVTVQNQDTWRLASLC